MREGCQQVQGYYFGRPVPARELTAFLRKWKGFGLENAAA
jgi:EAL domain-containing protein (putative c-di-GMP-specific phosphodiesterase class I)